MRVEFWTEARVERILREISVLADERKADDVSLLREENARLSAELQEAGKRYMAAMKDLQERGAKMEQLMRQLVNDRTSLMSELSGMREEKERRDREAGANLLLSEKLSRSEVGVQAGGSCQRGLTVERWTQTSVEPDIELVPRSRMCSRGVGPSSPSSLSVGFTPVAYAYGFVPPTSISYSRGAEHLALAVYASGRWIDNVKLDVRSPDWVFVGVNLEGWWHWKRQTSWQLNAAANVVRAYGDGAKQLWWCVALSAALMDLDTDHSMTVAEFLVAGFGCNLGSHMTLNSATFSHKVKLLTANPRCLLLAMRGETMYGSNGCDAALILAAACSTDEEALFYLLRTRVVSTDACGDDTAMSPSCMLVGEWLSCQQILGQFNTFQTVECGSLGSTSEVRWPDALEDHFATVAMRLQGATAPVVGHSIRARLLDCTTLSWWPVEIISRGGDVFALYSPLLGHAASIVVVLLVDVNTVGRIDFLQFLPDGDLHPNTEKVMIVQVDGQEVCGDGVTLNASLQQQQQQEEQEEAQGVGKDGWCVSRHHEVDVTAVSEYCVALVNLVADHLKMCGEALLGALVLQWRDARCEVNKLLFATHSNMTSTVDLAADHNDNVFELFVAALSSVAPQSNDVDTPKYSLSSLLSCTVARQNAELQLLKSRNDYMNASLCRASAKLSETRKNLVSTTHESSALRRDLARCASAFDVLRRAAIPKDVQLAEAQRYCSDVEGELQNATAAFLDLRASIAQLLTGCSAELLETSLLVPSTQAEGARPEQHPVASTGEGNLL